MEPLKTLFYSGILSTNNYISCFYNLRSFENFNKYIKDHTTNDGDGATAAATAAAVADDSSISTNDKVKQLMDIANPILIENGLKSDEINNKKAMELDDNKKAHINEISNYYGALVGLNTLTNRRRRK